MAKDPQEIVSNLESQVDDILQMYDIAEQSYSYENSRPKGFQANEHLQRQNVASVAQGPTDLMTLCGSSVYGLAAVYLMSRRGASSFMDLSRASQCYFRTTSWFMLGTSFGAVASVGKAKKTFNNPTTLLLQTRVSQNEQAHNILRSMKFHLATRQMQVWEQNPR